MNIGITYEQALEKASPRLRRLMEHSYEVLRKGEKLALFYDPQDGYWCGFSGGKDSQALYHMAQLSGVKIKAFFSPTSIDPPEVIRFIRKHYPEVSFTPLKTSIFKMFESKKTLPSMRIRWCCAEFKEKGGEGKVTLVGVRHSESARRANRGTISVTNHKFNGEFDEFEQYREDKRNAKLKTLDNKRKKMQRELRMGRISEEEYKQFDQWSHHEEKMVTCVGGKDKIVVSPILEWKDTDVWEFLNNVVEVPHCELYDQGSTRIGCIGCPMATSRVQRAQFERWPHVRERWIKSIMKVRKQSIEELNKWYKEGCNNTPPRIPYSAQSFQEKIQMWHASTNIGKILPPREELPFIKDAAGLQGRMGFRMAPMIIPRSLERTTKRKSEKSRRIFWIGGFQNCPITNGMPRDFHRDCLTITN